MLLGCLVVLDLTSTNPLVSFPADFVNLSFNSHAFGAQDGDRNRIGNQCTGQCCGLSKTFPRHPTVNELRCDCQPSESLTVTERAYFCACVKAPFIEGGTEVCCAKGARQIQDQAKRIAELERSKISLASMSTSTGKARAGILRSSRNTKPRSERPDRSLPDPFVLTPAAELLEIRVARDH